MKNGENVVMIHTCEKLLFNNINLIYSVTGKLTNHKGLYNRNIYVKFLKIINRKHICMYVSMCVLLLCLLIWISCQTYVMKHYFYFDPIDKPSETCLSFNSKELIQSTM